MSRNKHFALALLMAASAVGSAAANDLVQDWNVTLCDAAKFVVAKHNPGVPTRAMAMMNGSIYDIFQAVNRTHQPFKVNTSAPGASVDAAVSQAAWRVLSDMYPEYQTTLDGLRSTRLGNVPAGTAKDDGIALGNYVADHYIMSHQNDGWNLPDAYTAPGGMGHWTTDPMLDPVVQKGWGSDWGSVTTWAVPDADYFDAVTPFKIADLNTQRYTDAYNEVKAYGSRNSAMRSAKQTETALFYAYDRAGTGAPPVLFTEFMIEIGNTVGNTPADNARMFAQASVSLADAIIACWDQKYEVDLWRPITAIRDGASDGNPNTDGDASWAYLGAPGDQPALATDDFTPPFPSYISGHASMGGAIFKSIERFYGTNDFAAADAAIGADIVDSHFTVQSAEAGSGPARDFVRFTQVGPIGPGLENSPEGENAMSRIYMGVHWRMDQEDGQALGEAVANYVAANFFQAVPEPSGGVLSAIAFCIASVPRRRRTPS
jgi:hypothetical protein